MNQVLNDVPRLLLADDHAILREGLKSILEEEGYAVVGEAGDGHEAVRLGQQLSPDVAILDISMPTLNGIDAAREIQRLSPKTKVVLLTMHCEDRYVLAGLRAGISGYVLKNKAASTLIQAIQAAQRGDTFLTPEVSRAVVNGYLAKDENPLSPREHQALQLTAEGKNTKEIACILGISTKTAEAHRARVMEKLNIHDLAGLIRYALRMGLIAPD